MIMNICLLIPWYLIRLENISLYFTCTIEYGVTQKSQGVLHVKILTYESIEPTKPKWSLMFWKYMVCFFCPNKSSIGKSWVFSLAWVVLWAILLRLLDQQTNSLGKHYALEIVKLLCVWEESLKTKTMPLSNVPFHPRISKIYSNIVKHIVEKLPFPFIGMKVFSIPWQKPIPSFCFSFA